MPDLGDLGEWAIESGLWDGMSELPANAAKTKFVTICPLDHHCDSYEPIAYYCRYCDVLYLFTRMARKAP